MGVEQGVRVILPARRVATDGESFSISDVVRP